MKFKLNYTMKGGFNMFVMIRFESLILFSVSDSFLLHFVALM